MDKLLEGLDLTDLDFDFIKAAVLEKLNNNLQIIEKNLNSLMSRKRSLATKFTIEKEVENIESISKNKILYCKR